MFNHGLRDPLGPGASVPAPSGRPHEFGRLISQTIVSENETYYHHYDALGSTAVLTDGDEVVTDEYAYEAFGETAAESGPTPNPHLWVAETGYRKDEETGLYDLRRRKYSPQTGRFASEDPIRDGEENLYRYVGNDPVKKVDPGGLTIEIPETDFERFLQTESGLVTILLHLPDIDADEVISILPSDRLKKIRTFIENERWQPDNIPKALSLLQYMSQCDCALELTKEEALDIMKLWKIIVIQSSGAWAPSDAARIFHILQIRFGDEPGGPEISMSISPSVNIPPDETNEPETKLTRAEYQNKVKQHAEYDIDMARPGRLINYVTSIYHARRHLISHIDRELEWRTTVEPAVVLARVASEPIDVVLTIKDIFEDPSNPVNYIGLLPLVPGTGKTTRIADNGDEVLKRGGHTAQPSVSPTTYSHREALDGLGKNSDNASSANQLTARDDGLKPAATPKETVPQKPPENIAAPTGTVDSIPSVRNGEFNRWFNKLSADELDEIWKNPKLRNAIEDRLRHPGGLHEWHLVSRTPTFKRWGLTVDQIKDMRSLINDTHFVNPVGRHGGKGSTAAHNDLLGIIDSSLNYETFVRRLQTWAHYRLKGGASALPPGLRP